MSDTARKNSQMDDTGEFQKPLSRTRIRTGLVITLAGFFIFIVGAKPDWLGWDRSPVVGFVQIAVFLVGLAIICLGGYIGLLALWGGGQRSIAADIGLRLVSTGVGGDRHWDWVFAFSALSNAHKLGNISLR
jgi:hypothetical protein